MTKYDVPTISKKSKNGKCFTTVFRLKVTFVLRKYDETIALHVVKIISRLGFNLYRRTDPTHYSLFIMK